MNNGTLQYIVSFLTIGCIFSVLCLGVNVRYGWTGDLDLSYYLFVAVGAYMYAVLTLPKPDLPPPNAYILGLSWPTIPAVVVAMLVCGALSLVIGAIALRRLRGDYFAIVTIATTLIFYAFFSQDTSLFNGFNGLFGVDQPFEAQLQLSQTDYPLFFLGLCVIVLIGTYLFVQRLYKSPFSRAVRAIREDEVAAQAFGRNVYALKLRTFVIGGMIAGLGGCLLVNFLSAWSPGAWAPIETLLLYAAVFVGGTANNRGVIIGAFFIFVAIQESTRYLPTFALGEGQLAAFRDVVIGLLIIAVLRLRPQGLLPEPRNRDGKRRWGRRAPPPQSDSPEHSPLGEPVGTTVA